MTSIRQHLIDKHWFFEGDEALVGTEDVLYALHKDVHSDDEADLIATHYPDEYVGEDND